MTREKFIKKWLGNKDYQYTEQNRDLMRDDLDEMIKQALHQPPVSGSSIVIPKPKLKFEGLDNLSIIGENNIPLSELFELHLKLENYLKSRPEAIINERGSIVGFKNYR